MSELIKTVATTERTATKTRKIDSTTTHFEVDGYLVDRMLYNLISRNVKKGINTMLLGPTGVGKTELVNAIAKTMELPLTILDMGTMTDPIVSLVGTHTLTTTDDGSTQSSFKRSRFSDVIQRPGIVLLDEISRAPAQANNLLFPVLDFRKELAMEYDFEDSTPVKVHPECVFIATANLGSEYTGAGKIDRALADRFMTLQVKQLDTKNLVEVMYAQYSKLSKKTVKQIVAMFDLIDHKFRNFEIEKNMSIRHLKYVCGLVSDGYTPFDAFVAIYEGLAFSDIDKFKELIFDDSSKS